MLFCRTKPGSDEFMDRALFIKKLAYSQMHRTIQRNVFKIELLNLDRFVKPEDDNFSANGSNPIECFSSQDEDSLID